MAVPRPRGTAGALPGEEAVRASKRRRPSICYTERLSRTGRRPPVDSPAMTDLDEQGHPEPPLAGDETATLVAEALADGGLDQLATGVTNDQGESPSLRRLFGMATLPLPVAGVPPGKYSPRSPAGPTATAPVTCTSRSNPATTRRGGCTNAPDSPSCAGITTARPGASPHDHGAPPERPRYR